MRSFASRFPGKCCICGEQFPKGAMIVWNRVVKGQVAHYDCYSNNGSKFPEPKQATFATNETSATTEAVTIPTAASNDLAQAIATAVGPLVQVNREQVSAMIDDKLNEALSSFTNDSVPEANIIALIEKYAVKRIVIEDAKTGEVKDMGIQHKMFPTLLTMIKARASEHRLNIWITGPAGSGKTTAAEKCAAALGLDFAVTGSLTESYKLYGFMSPGTGAYVATPFRKIWEHGGVFIFDDFDGSDPNCALEFNSALANGTCAFPDGMVPRHPDCVLILTANTWGHGGTNEYVGRLKQDQAFLNRFVKLHWDYDEELERATCPNTEWVRRVQSIRAKVAKRGIKVLVTPRASYYGAALIAAGMTFEEAETATMRADMTADQWESVC